LLEEVVEEEEHQLTQVVEVELVVLEKVKLLLVLIQLVH
tara:strand:+ start:83 stop:199 length:117 start_codon:yes stop_codon:yes gene_type:complete